MALAAASLAALVVFDALAVSVLLPSIRVDLGASSSGAQWVLNAYLLALAALLPVLARLAGSVPVRTLAAAGGVALAVGAALCASADVTSALVAGRALQGAGAAALLASVAGSAEAARRPTGPAAALLALAVVGGPVAGGAFAELNWFRIFFWAGIPVAAIAAGSALVVARPASVPAQRDLPRLLALGAGLTAVTVALVQSEVWSWGQTTLLLASGLGLLYLAPWRLLDRVAVAWAAVAACVAGLAFLLPQYFELARILSGLRVGALLLAFTLPAVTSWALARRLAARLPVRGLAIAGLVCAVAALAVLGALEEDTPYAVLIVVMLAAGSGLGTVAATAGGRTGAELSGVTIAATAAGAALGLAAAGAELQHAQADERAADASFEHALAAGVGRAALLLALLLAATAVSVVRLDRRG